MAPGGYRARGERAEVVASLRESGLSLRGPQLPVSSTVITQHRQRDRTASEGFVGQANPAITLDRDSELVVQILKMLFDGCLGDEQLTSHPTN